MRIVLSAFLTAALLPGLAAGAEGQRGTSIGVPSLGLVYDSTGAIRRISGTAGAATLGQPLDLGFPVAKAVVAREGRYVLAISAGDGKVHVVRFDGTTAVARVIGGALTSVTRMALSPAGRAAVFYDEHSSRLQVIRGLPDDPVIFQEFAVTSEAATTDPAVSDDGGRVLFAGESLWLFDAESGLAQVPLASRMAAISFRPGMQEALAASVSGELYRIEAGGGVTRFGHAVPPGAAVPVAVQMSADGTRGYVAFNDGLLASVDTKRDETKYLACQCTPAGLKALNASGIFAVNGDSPLRLFDVSGAEPRLWFVPLDRMGDDASGSAQ